MSRDSRHATDKHHILVDEELVSFLPELQKPLRIVPFTGRLLNNSMLGEAEVLVVRSVTQVCEELIGGSKIRLVCSTTSGMDHIDQLYLEKINAGLVNAPGANAIAVVEYVIFSILLYLKTMEKSLEELKIGVIGYGEIGSRLTSILESMGVQVLVNDTPKYNNCDLGRQHFPLEKLIKNCDCLSIHVPFDTKEPFATENLLDYEFLKKVKDHALIINSSRGGIINERDLCRVLDEKPNLKVVLDCWLDEPRVNITLAKKVWLATPHIAGGTEDSKFRAVNKILPAINNYYGLSNKAVLQIKQKIQKKIVTNIAEAELEEFINLVIPFYRISTRLKAAAANKSIPLLMKEFDNLRKSLVGRNELSNYIFPDDLVIIEKIRNLLNQF